MSPSAPRRRLRRVEETSAGGLVLDSTEATQARAALIGRIDRRGRLLWSLPKGHVEPGETVEQTAVREVAEETGITGRVVASLGTIDFWFVAEGRRIHKTVHHYLLLATDGELSADDIEVEEVAWVPLSELEERLAYADERRLVAKVPDLLADTA
ncbi:MAG: NUDIX hydrolase [Frankiaceae bacterium]|nr:NUDIX hydrolase [Frankiaceae bacterium]MBV9369724.1 NUDIX hydrolase [Frankiales bacterium]